MMADVLHKNKLNQMCVYFMYSKLKKQQGHKVCQHLVMLYFCCGIY